MVDVWWLFRFDRDATPHRITPRLSGHKRKPAERVHREPSGLAVVDVWWPVLGRMHVADGGRQDSRSGT